MHIVVTCVTLVVWDSRLFTLIPTKTPLVSGPLYPKLSMCFEGAWLTQLVQLVTASRLFLGHKRRVDL